MYKKIINTTQTYSENLQKYFKIQDCSWLTLKKHYRKEASRKSYPKRILSGIQPTGNLHLGNYIGAVQRWVELQNSGEDTFWCIADMHAITVLQDPQSLWDNILKLCAILLACGIDPNRSTLFQQSRIGMHGELCWILSTLLMTNRLTHLHHYKEKAKNQETMLHGLLSYPILQAADILLYKGTHIPVGQDQIQHIQLVQHLAQKFNSSFGETFPMPDALIGMSGNRIRSLRDPTKKMSKSNPDIKGKINLTDDPDVILKKIKKAVTDFTSEVTYDEENRPGVSNLITIHSLLSGKSVEQICKEAEALDTGKYKLFVADVLIEKLSPIRERYLQLLQQPDFLIDVLKEGTEKAKTEAAMCLQEVYIRIGHSVFDGKNRNARDIKVEKLK